MGMHSHNKPGAKAQGKKVIFQICYKEHPCLIMMEQLMSRGITPSAVLHQMSRWIPFLVSRKMVPINRKKLSLIIHHNHPRRIENFFFFWRFYYRSCQETQVLILTMKSASEFMSNNNTNGFFFLGVVSYGDRKA